MPGTGKVAQMKGFLIVAIFMMPQWTGADLFAQDDDTTDFKGLILKKFDADRDGALAGLEKFGAVIFLKGVDSNGDGEISEDEQSDAVAALKRMPAPLKPTPIPAPAQIPGSKPAPTPTPKQRSISEGAKPKITIGMPPTPESIAKKRAKMGLGRATEKPATRGGGTVPKKAQGYYENSTIIAVSGAHAVLPKGSVLHVPPSLAGMIVKSPKGKLLGWPQFLAENLRYINTFEVAMEVAKGERRIKGSEKREFAGNNKIVVAVFNKNPVTVLKTVRGK